MHAAVRWLQINLGEMKWPPTLQIRSKRFRLLVAADVSLIPKVELIAFAREALSRGMIYFCAWGPGCERFHDCVDAVRDEQEGKNFKGPYPDDVIMTTWHDDEPLEETLEFFASWSIPTEGFIESSHFWLALTLNNWEWSQTISDYLRTCAERGFFERP